jgi:hypothetical protein
MKPHLPTATMRLTTLAFPALVLCSLSLLPLKADEFTITFFDSMSNVVGTGDFTTDGTCTTCIAGIPGTGLLTFTASIGRDSGGDAFDITDDASIRPVVYFRSTNILSFDGLVDSETSDILNGANTRLEVTLRGVGGTTNDTFTVAPTPEPGSVILFITILALVAWMLRGRLLGLRT